MNQIIHDRFRMLNAAALFVCSSLILGLCISCDNESNSQDNKVEFSENYSGSFETGTAATDTNDDGRPANIGQFAGSSTFGSATIQSLNEFEPVLEHAECALGEDEFSLVRGHFVKRFQNGELLFVTWTSGVSCFDPVTNTSTTTQVGIFSGGTEQFVNASGPVQLDFTSTFLATPGTDGFTFGGTSGTEFGTLIFNGN